MIKEGTCLKSGDVGQVLNKNSACVFTKEKETWRTVRSVWNTKIPGQFEIKEVVLGLLNIGVNKSQDPTGSIPGY